MKNEKVYYDKKQIEEAMNEIYFLLFSYRDIFDVSAYDHDFDYKEAFAKLSIDEKILDRLAKIRTILEEPFRDYPSNGDITYIEQIYNNTRKNLWKVKDKCIQEKN